MDQTENLAARFREEKTGKWDLRGTIIVLALLLVPMPFARFESWPGGRVISEHPVTPWSQFRVCYKDFPSNSTVEDAYAFTWKGDLISSGGSPPNLFIFSPANPPLLQWRNSPALVLKDSFYNGRFLKLETFWQPVLLWPFRMVWRSLYDR